MDYKAIPTFFEGITYRSRNEARWSVFFSKLGLRPVYEPEGYAIEGKSYLPDFGFYDPDFFVEIKPNGTAAGLEADRKAQLLADATGMPVFMFGRIANPYHQEPTVGSAFFPRVGKDEPYHWTECPDCQILYPTYNGRLDKMPCLHYADNKSYSWNTNRLIAAYETAISA